MDRRLARRNMAVGIAMFATLFLLMGVAFAWAQLFLAVNK
jgi:hypothetical protein